MDYWDFLFGAEQRGLVRVALRTKDRKFNQQFVRWPDDKEKLLALPGAKDRGDLYFSPALFSGENSKKDGVLGARVAWIDLDAPKEFQPDGLPSPGLVVSSGNGKHIYWRIEQQPKLEVETYNLYLMAKLGGDPTGWDANQLLRIPDTLNWKDSRNPKPVEVLEFNAQTEILQAEHRLVREWFPAELSVKSVSLIEALQSFEVDQTIVKLLERQPIEIFDRSNALFHLAAELTERGLRPETIYPLLAYADSKWGKFTGRDDKELRLQEIIHRAAQRTLILYGTDLPEDVLTQPVQKLAQSLRNDRPKPVGWFDLENNTEPISWVVQDIIRERGLVLLYGPTGIGKSTLAINMAAMVAMGSSHWLNWPIAEGNQKILYSSLEMDASEVMFFTQKMSPFVTDAKSRERLNNNLHFLPVGVSVYLDTQDGKDYYESLFKEHKYTGFVIDTLGASVSSSLSNEKVMREVADWLDKMRLEYGIWVLVLHHPRKEQNVRHRAGALQYDGTDDSFGSRIIGDRANSILKIFRGNSPDKLELMVPKSRFAPRSGNLVLQRNEQFFFRVVTTRGLEVQSRAVDQDFPEDVVVSEGDGNEGSTKEEPGPEAFL